METTTRVTRGSLRSARTARIPRVPVLTAAGLLTATAAVAAPAAGVLLGAAANAALYVLAAGHCVRERSWVPEVFDRRLVVAVTVLVAAVAGPLLRDLSGIG